MNGLHISMRPVLIAAEDTWRRFGRSEGVTVTSALDGLHSAGSLHYYGRALDFRTRYWSHNVQEQVYNTLCSLLSKDYDVILHRSHIHVEYDPN